MVRAVDESNLRQAVVILLRLLRSNAALLEWYINAHCAPEERPAHIKPVLDAIYMLHNLPAGIDALLKEVDAVKAHSGTTCQRVDCPRCIPQ